MSAERYFRCGDVDNLKKKMEVLLEKGLPEKERQEIRNQIEEKYNPSTIFRTYGAGWDKIAEQTIEVYRKALARRAKSRERRAESGERRAESRGRKAKSGEQRAESREHRAWSKERRANLGITNMLECWPQWNSPSDVRKAEFHGVKIKELRN